MTIATEIFSALSCFLAETGWNCSSNLSLLGSGHISLHETYQLPNVQQKTLDDGTEDARNM